MKSRRSRLSAPRRLQGPLEFEYVFNIYCAPMEHAIRWSAEKNAELRARHGFGFERIVLAISEGSVLDVRDHPNKRKYAHQQQLIVEIDGYVWVVPLVMDGDVMFLKTLFPSRKATREFFGGDDAKRKN